MVDTVTRDIREHVRFRHEPVVPTGTHDRVARLLVGMVRQYGDLCYRQGEEAADGKPERAAHFEGRARDQLDLITRILAGNADLKDFINELELDMANALLNNRQLAIRDNVSATRIADVCASVAMGDG